MDLENAEGNRCSEICGTNAPTVLWVEHSSLIFLYKYNQAFGTSDFLQQTQALWLPILTTWYSPSCLVCGGCAAAAPTLIAAIIYGHLAWTEEGARHTAHPGTRLGDLHAEHTAPTWQSQTQNQDCPGEKGPSSEIRITLILRGTICFLHFFSMLRSHVLTSSLQNLNEKK